MAANQSVLLAQKLLNELGYTDATGRKLVEDGLWGPKTYAALQKFYAAKFNAAAPNGIDQQVLNRLSAALQEQGLDLTPSPPAALPVLPGTRAEAWTPPPPPAPKRKPVPPLVWALGGLLVFMWLNKKIPTKGTATALAGYRRRR